MRAKKGRIAGAIVITFVAVLFVAVTVTASFLPIAANAITRLTTNWGWERESYDGTEIYYAREQESFAAARAASRQIAERVQEEGTVLLENDGALPLAADERRVTVFGSASVNIAVGGTGSGEGSSSGAVGLYEALADAGFVVNPALKSFYEKKKGEGYVRGKGTDMNGAYYGTAGARDHGYSVNEPPRALYEDLRTSYADYADAAVVVIGRSGGEGQDLPTSMRDFYENDDKHYLELTDEELDLLAEVRAGGFGKTVVLLNTLNAFELGFLKDPENGVDAALWIGGTGVYGMTAVAEILTGAREPAGRLPDTYAADLLSAPAMQNYGDNRYVENGEVTTAAYVVYAESIYIGYRYYETRFADVFRRQANAGDFDYDAEVVYPFGYGLSYTSFEWSDYALTADGDTFTASVTVRNTGGRAGRDTVQFYVTKPYTAFDVGIGMEKSFVELIAYAKTPLLAAGESATVTAEFPRRALASYDGYNSRTYLLEDGDYYVTAGADAHDAALKALSAYRSGETDRVKIYNVVTNERLDRSVTGYEITNRFDTETLPSSLKKMRYLTRKDWTGTFPTPYGDAGRVAGKAYKNLDVTTKHRLLDRGGTAHLGPNNDETDFVFNKTTGKTETIAIAAPVTDSGAGLNFIDMIDENGRVTAYDDPKWQALVECLSRDELYLLCSSGAGQTAQIPSVNKKRSATSDSPMGLHGGTLFPCYPIQAATFDRALAAELGDALGEEALWLDVRGWYAPACNTHRTPFGGRNYEYYSEDGTLAGYYAASVVRAVQRRGVYVQLKHFALNDQDTNRGDRGNYKNDDPYNGLCTYANEQTIREIYLRPFELAVTVGGAHGVMTSYNRIGTTWAGGHYGLVTEVLRNEWGMEGLALTDYAGTFGYEYMDMDQGLRAGGDLWLYPQDAFPRAETESDAAVYYMQKAARHIFYAEACSSRVNGLRRLDGTPVRIGRPVFKWQIVFVLTDIAVAVASVLGVYFLLRGNRAAPKSARRGG